MEVADAGSDEWRGPWCNPTCRLDILKTILADAAGITAGCMLVLLFRCCCGGSGKLNSESRSVFQQPQKIHKNVASFFHSCDVTRLVPAYPGCFLFADTKSGIVMRILEACVTSFVWLVCWRNDCEGTGSAIAAVNSRPKKVPSLFRYDDGSVKKLEGTNNLFSQKQGHSHT